LNITCLFAFASSFPFDLKIKNSGASLWLATLYCIHKIKPKFRLGALAFLLCTSFYSLIERCFCSAPHCKILLFIHSHGTSFLVESFFSYLIFLAERLEELFSNVRYENSRQSFLSFGLAVEIP
ncbi:hypothetical protein ACQ1Q9_05715, partial [Ornithobacterium rhinotracheale]